MVLAIGVVAKSDAICLSRKTFAGLGVLTACIWGVVLIGIDAFAEDVHLTNRLTPHPGPLPVEGRGGTIPQSVSFRNDVMAVLSKAGCNAGTCHGNQNGKAGFKLSLRGEDPDADYNVLTRDAFGRRVNPLEPEQSLVLLKPTTEIAHEGGHRFSRGTAE